MLRLATSGRITAAQRMKAEAKFHELVETKILELMNLNDRVLRKAGQVLRIPSTSEVSTQSHAPPRAG